MNEQTKEALKMAIEALERAEQVSVVAYSKDYEKEIQACKEALEQEPDALEAIQDAIDFLDGSYDAHKIRKALQEALAQPTQEPVAERFWVSDGNQSHWVYDDYDKSEGWEALYTHPSPSWQGLSDDEIEKIIENHDGQFWYVVCAIEQALKDKNT